MGVFGAVFGCSGDAGFSGALLGVCSGVVGFNVAMVSCLVRDNVRPAALCHRESARKFAQCAQIGPNSAFLRLLGEFFRGDVAGGAVLGELLRANWPCVGLGCDAVHFRVAAVGGFAPCEALWRRVVGVSEPWMASFPPIGGGELAVCGGVVAKLQTHWV